MSQQPDFDDPLPTDRPEPGDPEWLPPDDETLDPDIPEINDPDKPSRIF